MFYLVLFCFCKTAKRDGRLSGTVLTMPQNGNMPEGTPPFHRCTDGSIRQTVRRGGGPGPAPWRARR